MNAGCSPSASDAQNRSGTSGDARIDSAAVRHSAFITHATCVPFRPCPSEVDRSMPQASRSPALLPDGLRVLVVEDDPTTRDALAQGLTDAGGEVVAAADGVEALRLATETQADLIVLDLRLPLLDGEHVIAHLRKKPSPPIIVVSAKRSEETRVRALDLGADDFLVKPFSLQELTARMRAVLRRSGAAVPATTPLDLSLDAAALTVTRGGTRVPLTAQEFALLELLARERGRIVSRDEIEAAIMTEGRPDCSNVVDVVVMRLRKKLGRDLIATRRGQGFMIDQ